MCFLKQWGSWRIERGGKINRSRISAVMLEIIIILVAVVVFGYGAYQLAYTGLDYKRASDEYGEIKKEYVRDESTGKEERESDASEEKGRVDFTGLQNQNGDTVGWLVMDGLGISYPIMQSDDNAYYLKHTFERNYHFAGSIFMDCQNSSDLTDQNTILYGHNMKDGSMFGKLKEYKSQERYEGNQYMWVYTPDKVRRYEVFSCRLVNANSGAYRQQFDGAEEFTEYASQAVHDSIIKSKENISFRKDDAIITLSTCSSDADTRLIVQGVLR